MTIRTFPCPNVRYLIHTVLPTPLAPCVLVDDFYFAECLAADCAEVAAKRRRGRELRRDTDEGPPARPVAAHAAALATDGLARPRTRNPLRRELTTAGDGAEAAEVFSVHSRSQRALYRRYIALSDALHSVFEPRPCLPPRVPRGGTTGGGRRRARAACGAGASCTSGRARTAGRTRARMQQTTNFCITYLTKLIS